MSAIELHARASKDFDAKLAATRAALQQLVHDHPRTSGAATAPVTQASSLGAEDMVTSHLVNSLALDVGIFVLQTGMLHAETLALLEQLKVVAAQVEADRFNQPSRTALAPATVPACALPASNGSSRCASKAAPANALRVSGPSPM